MNTPSAIQLYNAVKVKRAAANPSNRVLTIPEINAVLEAYIDQLTEDATLDTEWAIFFKDGTQHRGPWPEAEAREWLEECDEMGIKQGIFHIRTRTVSRWLSEEK